MSGKTKGEIVQDYIQSLNIGHKFGVYDPHYPHPKYTMQNVILIEFPSLCNEFFVVNMSDIKDNYLSERTKIYVNAEIKKIIDNQVVMNTDFWTSVEYTEPITSYRAWTVKSNVLSPLNSFGINWDKGMQTAQCFVRSGGSLNWIHKEEAPARACSCGFYSYRTIDDMFDDGWSKLTKNNVLGQVEIGGKVWPHQFGWRSQYAMIKAIYNSSKIKALTLVDEVIDVEIMSSNRHPREVSIFKTCLRSSLEELRTVDKKMADDYDVPLIEFPDELHERLSNGVTIPEDEGLVTVTERVMIPFGQDPEAWKINYINKNLGKKTTR